MERCEGNCAAGHDIIVSDDVKSYIIQKNIDFRVCTSCGGPVLLSTTVKSPKPSDYEIYVGDNIIYVSMYQARYLDRIEMDMVPAYCNYL
ncbi:hypothetical protein [Methanogenium organophilum]|uniref:Uncharacterized protein n=1 Tax=Methanogenium organophilum TaxID=2199 RepID=A0A9X9S4T5_METOG|nr:hypothetical protein [Methanogenium organophilum]WAI01536.1 hypothetical protein OU421_01290 [Methanogenium organophilum]